MNNSSANLKWFLQLSLQQVLREVPVFGASSGLYFLAFRLNTERYSVSRRIQYECGKIRTRKTRNTGTVHGVRFSWNSSLMYGSCEYEIFNELWVVSFCKQSSRHFGMSVLPQIYCIFSEHIFLRTPLDGCFWANLTRKRFPIRKSATPSVGLKQYIVFFRESLR